MVRAQVTAWSERRSQGGASAVVITGNSLPAGWCGVVVAVQPTTPTPALCAGIMALSVWCIGDSGRRDACAPGCGVELSSWLLWLLWLHWLRLIGVEMTRADVARSRAAEGKRAGKGTARPAADA